MNQEEIMLALSVLFVLAAVGCSAAGFLADQRTVDGATRQVRTAFAAMLLYFAAAAAAVCSGGDSGIPIGGFWMMVATTQTINVGNRSGKARKLKADREQQRLQAEQERRAQLERETADADRLAEEFGLAKTPRITDHQ